MQIIDNIASLVRLLLPTRLRKSRFVQLVVSLLSRTWSHLQQAWQHYRYEYMYARYTSQIASLNEALHERFGIGYYVEDDFRYPIYFGEGVIVPRYRQIVPATPPFIIGVVRQPTYSCIVHVPNGYWGHTLEDVDIFVRRYIYCGIRYVIQVDPPTTNPNQPPSTVQM